MELPNAAPKKKFATWNPAQINETKPQPGLSAKQTQMEPRKKNDRGCVAMQVVKLLVAQSCDLRRVARFSSMPEVGSKNNRRCVGWACAASLAARGGAHMRPK